MLYILEKSLGAAAKGGTTPLNDVLLYAEKAKSKGFLFMDSPGYDPASKAEAKRQLDRMDAGLPRFPTS